MPISNISNLIDHAGDIFRHVSRAYRHRRQLASLESTEARIQAAKIGILGAIVLALTLLGLFLFALTIAAFVWPMENRVLILGLVTAFFALSASTCFFITWRKFQLWSPWSETRHQLNEDCACLGEIISEITPDSKNEAHDSH